MKLTQEQLDSLSPELRAQVVAMQTALENSTQGGHVVVTESGQRFSLKVSEKGAVSIYGFGRFPVTIYPKNLTALLDGQVQIRTFIKDNTTKLSWAQTDEQKAARKAQYATEAAAKKAANG